jgi:glycolate oxidase iron-sulfur subunit
MLQEYGNLLQDDPAYAAKARRVSELFRDLSEVVAVETAGLPMRTGSMPIAFHSPCSLQHGLKIRGSVERILTQAGYRLAPVADSHLCCGSAGTYSLLQPALSKSLKANKLRALEAGKPQAIASANIGCILQLASGTKTPVRHWIELVEQAFEDGKR